MVARVAEDLEIEIKGTIPHELLQPFYLDSSVEKDVREFMIKLAVAQGIFTSWLKKCYGLSDLQALAILTAVHCKAMPVALRQINAAYQGNVRTKENHGN